MEGGSSKNLACSSSRSKSAESSVESCFVSMDLRVCKPANPPDFSKTMCTTKMLLPNGGRFEEQRLRGCNFNPDLVPRGLHCVLFQAVLTKLLAGHRKSGISGVLEH